MTSEYSLPSQSLSPSVAPEPPSSRISSDLAQTPDISAHRNTDVLLIRKPESLGEDNDAEHKNGSDEDTNPSKQNSDTQSGPHISAAPPPVFNAIQDETPLGEDVDALQGSNITTDWDPLRGTEDSIEQRRVHDTTLSGEAGDFVDSNGRVLFTENGTEPSPAGSRRASHLRLDIKPPSPQPWDLVEPPSSNNDIAHYSPGASDSHKFHAMQDATHTRPLIPKSSYYFGPPPSDSAYGTPPIGQIGVHHPREILRVERDYTGGELIQFAPIYPLELEGRITPTQFLESINSINEVLISAHSLRHAFLDNVLSIFTFQLSRLILTTHYEKEMQRLKHLIDDLNTGLYNPVGLNIIWPRDVAFLFLEIEYY